MAINSNPCLRAKIVEYRTRLTDCLSFIYCGGNMRQQTIGQQFEIEGIGLHSGLKSKLVFKPLAENSGIFFKRSDLPDAPALPALWSKVVDTRNCTCLGSDDKTSSAP